MVSLLRYDKNNELESSVCYDWVGYDHYDWNYWTSSTTEMYEMEILLEKWKHKLIVKHPSMTA